MNRGYYDMRNEKSSQRLSNSNVGELKDKYGLSYEEIDFYVTDILSCKGIYATVGDFEEYIKSKGHHQIIETEEEVSESRLFDTTQNNVVVPTKELIRIKGTDFRVFLGVSAISNADDVTKVGKNIRYTSFKKVDRNMDILCKSINISPSQFKKHLRMLVKCKSDEFKIVDRMCNGNIVKCYEIAYAEGGFITIPYHKVESILVGGSNNCIKLYANLLWLCQQNGGFIEKHISQETLLELMGLSPTTRRIITITTEWLEGANLIRTEKRWESETIINDEGLPMGSSPKSKIYYSIVTE